MVREGKALLARRARDPHAGLWELPGGFQDLGEHPADTARRELREELGLEVRLAGVLGIYLSTYWSDVIQVIVFLAEADGEPRPDPLEVSDWGWFEPDLLPPPAEITPIHNPALSDWRRILKGEASLGLGLDPSQD